MSKRRPFRVLIPFNTAYLYGMERAVIEGFDAVRPEIDPRFLITNTALERDLPVVRELRDRKLPFVTFSDRGDWPRIGYPRSAREAWGIAQAIFRGNRDVLRTALDCDALYLPSVGYANFALAAMILFRSTRRPVFHHFHDLATSRSARLRGLNWLVTRHLHNTGAGCEWMLRAHPFLATRSNAVTPYCVELHPPSAEAGDIAPAMDGWRNLVFLGRLVEEKGVYLLLDAFARIAPRYADARLHLVGGCGPDDDSRLAQLIGQSRLGGRVVNWGWRSDSHAILRRAWIHIQPSLPGRHDESFGRSAAEAMGLGVPTVCLVNGVLPDVVGHEQGGLVCPSATAAELASTLARLLDDEALRAWLAAGARERWERLYEPSRARQAWLRSLLEANA